MIRTRLFAALSALATLLFAPPASAESFRADYQAEVLGVVQVGRASLQGAAANGRYTVTATLRTSGVAALFDQTNITASASGVINERGITWSGYNLSHAYARKFRRISMRRGGGDVRSTINPRFGNMGNPPSTRTQRWQSYDPVSALFVLGRLVGRARACTGNLLVFDGKQVYRLTLSAIASGSYNGGGYNGAAVQCRMRYTPIAGFDMTAEERRNIPSATAWFSRPARPGFSVPLDIRVPTPLGDARMSIRAYRYTP